MANEKTKVLKNLQTTVWNYYKKHGRHDLPWRKTYNPYRILVSEVMLQQTQVPRVLPKYRAFLKKFPTIQKLAQAPQGEVLRMWQGLGYNRRAKALHELARVVVRDFHGKVPAKYEELVTLPGIGPYTSAAVCAFAYNTPVPMIETNIRTVLFHHVFSTHTHVRDKELLEVAALVLDTKHAREWHYALMDYGAFLKGQGVHANVKSAHYVKQKTFKGSDREVRGAIVRLLIQRKATEQDVVRTLQFERARIHEQLAKLKTEGMIRFVRGFWRV